MNERLLEFIIDAGALHLGDNPSRHSPIMLKLQVGHLKSRKTVKNLPPRRPAWSRAGDTEKYNYTELVQTRVNQLSTPDSLTAVSGCSDPYIPFFHIENFPQTRGV